MIRYFGAMMIIAAGGLLGCAAVWEMRRSCEELDLATRFVRALRTEIVSRRRPLPESLATLSAEFPRLLNRGGDISIRLKDRSFTECWEVLMRSADLPLREETALIRLGTELSLGASLEECFEICIASLQEEKKKTENRLFSVGNIYIAAGFAAGCFAVILLI